MVVSSIRPQAHRREGPSIATARVNTQHHRQRVRADPPRLHRARSPGPPIFSRNSPPALDYGSIQSGLLRKFFRPSLDHDRRLRSVNMVTAAGTAHPTACRSCSRAIRPAARSGVQQVEHFGDPTATVNDAFKAVSRYWDRITHPAQIIASMPQAIATMLDPGDAARPSSRFPRTPRNSPSLPLG